MYTDRNFRSKKQFKEAFASGAKLTYYQPGGMFPTPLNGTFTVEGPHSPAAHTWYARVAAENGVITKILG
jgi:hypothetical protein